jgi:branched-chain amino acid transport system permease protein
VGFDNIVSPILDAQIQALGGGAAPVVVAVGGLKLFTLPGIMFTFTGWRLMIFGLALILMMRYRPEGLIPSNRVKHELHPNETTSETRP